MKARNMNVEEKNEIPTQPLVHKTQHEHKYKPQQGYFEKLGEPCANVHHQIQVLHQHTRNRGHLKNEKVNLETVRSV